MPSPDIITVFKYTWIFENTFELFEQGAPDIHPDSIRHVFDVVK